MGSLTQNGKRFTGERINYYFGGRKKYSKVPSFDYYCAIETTFLYMQGYGKRFSVGGKVCYVSTKDETDIHRILFSNCFLVATTTPSVG